MKVSVIGCGNVGVAIAADLSIRGHEVTMIKSSKTNTEVYEKIKQNNNRILLKENGEYKESRLSYMTQDLKAVKDTDVIFITIQSTYHEELIKHISEFLTREQIVVIICSYMSSSYVRKFCKECPTIVETTGPYLEGRIEKEDVKDEIVFRVGCRLTRSPLSIFPHDKATWCMDKLKALYKGFSNDYSVVESALLNPNLVLHTVGSIMSIPRIEYSLGNFCMYREAYSRKNDATLRIMLQLDEEKKEVLKRFGCHPVDVFKAGGFLGDPMESFYAYSESSDRAISPTSIHSRYITEDVSQGLVLLEDMANAVDVQVPVTTAMINIASVALNYDFRTNGRTLSRLGVELHLEENKYECFK